jgi:6-pyruvoyltetrahydropterin/6-carboxytetrahydropterin synthase
MIIDFGDLKSIVKKAVLDSHDHTYLNDIYPNPTAENMVNEIARAITAELPSGRKLTMIKLWETEDSYAIWRPESI